jgi:hypothetical protein
MSKFNNKLSQVYKLKYLNFKYYNVAEVHIRKYEDFLFTTAFISNSRSIGEIVKSIMKSN